jgi:hypothetical protein
MGETGRTDAPALAREATRKDGSLVTGRQHAARIVLLMGCVAGLLGWMAGHTAVMFNDGLRYIDQAKKLDAGSLVEGLRTAVDHPAYPAGIALMHRFLVADGSPDAWQRSAQLASVAAGVLWVVPLYMVALELFGGASAWLAVVLAFLVPMTGHVMADVLSESTFLLFWTWGVYTALRFLRVGSFAWLPPTIALAALAYLARPEGLLLPMALIASLAAMPLLRSTRLLWPRWWAAVGFLVIGPAILIGPYIAMKGGLGTKPAVARLLGTAPRSAPTAVERQRPLDPDQSTATTYGLAARAMAEAVANAVTLPLLPLVLVGLCLAWPPRERSRPWLFVTIILVASALALIRLHATGGYCTPRHAMIVAYLLIPAAASGLHIMMGKLSIPGRWLGLDDARYTAGPAVWLIVLGGFVGLFATRVFTPLNAPMAGYREAGAWVAGHVKAGEKVADVTGLSLYYGDCAGYTFANIIDAAKDPSLRYVVVRDAHLHGPWPYCKQLHSLVVGLEPVEIFPKGRTDKQAKVFVYVRPAVVAQTPAPSPR